MNKVLTAQQEGEAGTAQPSTFDPQVTLDIGGDRRPATGLRNRVENSLLTHPLARRASRALAASPLGRALPKALVAPAGTPLGGVADRIIFEDDRVAIWDMHLAPGETSALHRHERDYILVQVSGDEAAVDFEPTSRDAYGMAGKRLAHPVVPGRVMVIPKGGVETARNTGSREYFEILIELKD